MYPIFKVSSSKKFQVFLRHLDGIISFVIEFITDILPSHQDNTICGVRSINIIYDTKNISFNIFFVPLPFSQ